MNFIPCATAAPTGGGSRKVSSESRLALRRRRDLRRRAPIIVHTPNLVKRISNKVSRNARRKERLRDHVNDLEMRLFQSEVVVKQLQHLIFSTWSTDPEPEIPQSLPLIPTSSVEYQSGDVRWIFTGIRWEKIAEQDEFASCPSEEWDGYGKMSEDSQDSPTTETRFYIGENAVAQEDVSEGNSLPMMWWRDKGNFSTGLEASASAPIASRSTPAERDVDKDDEMHAEDVLPIPIPEDFETLDVAAIWPARMDDDLESEIQVSEDTHEDQFVRSKKNAKTFSALELETKTKPFISLKMKSGYPALWRCAKMGRCCFIESLTKEGEDELARNDCESSIFAVLEKIKGMLERGFSPRLETSIAARFAHLRFYFDEHESTRSF